MKITVKNTYPGIICATIIMILCGLPGHCFPTVKTLWEWLSPDKVVHLLMFSGLSFSILIGFKGTFANESRKSQNTLLLSALIISILYGALTELLQKHVFFGRYGCVFDFLADTIGCIIGVLLFKLLLKKNDKN
ncbi:MAG: VanZ family protein [Candidatus Limimorpha sp.]